MSSDETKKAAEELYPLLEERHDVEYMGHNFIKRIEREAFLAGAAYRDAHPTREMVERVVGLSRATFLEEFSGDQAYLTVDEILEKLEND